MFFFCKSLFPYVIMYFKNVILENIVAIYYDTIVLPIWSSTKGPSLLGVIAKHRGSVTDHVFLLLRVPFFKCVAVFHVSPTPPLLASHMLCFLVRLYHILNMQNSIRSNNEYLLTNFNRTMTSSQTYFSYFKGMKPWKKQPCYLIVHFSICSYLPGPPVIGSILHSFFFYHFIIKFTFP